MSYVIYIKNWSNNTAKSLKLSFLTLIVFMKIFQDIIKKKTKKGFKEKKLVKSIKVFLKNKKRRSNNMVINDIKTLHRMKNKG